MKEITDRLEAGVKEFFNSNHYHEYLNTMRKFRQYSFNNILLIAAQHPSATFVAGYQSWKKNFGRFVKKGKKGIRILAPAPIKTERECEVLDAVTGKPVIGSDGKACPEKVEVTIPRFRVTTVFALDQTEGKPFPEMGPDEPQGSVPDYSVLLEAIRQVAKVPIRFAEIEGGKGYYSSTDKESMFLNIKLSC